MIYKTLRFHFLLIIHGPCIAKATAIKQFPGIRISSIFLRDYVSSTNKSVKNNKNK